MRRGDRPRPFTSVRIRAALRTSATFSSGSPWPIITMLMRFHPPTGRCRGRRKHLAYDLARRKIALESHQRGQAELAADGAADLRGDAQRVASLLRHEDGLDRFAVGEPQQIALRPVRRLVDRDGLGIAETAAQCERLPQRLGERRQIVEGRRAAMVQRFIHLARAKRRLVRGQQRANLFGFKSQQRLHRSGPLLPIVHPRPSARGVAARMEFMTLDGTERDVRMTVLPNGIRVITEPHARGAQRGRGFLDRSGFALRSRPR